MKASFCAYAMIAITLSGCATPPRAQAPQQGLAGTSWTLVRFQASADATGAVVPPDVERYTLEFLSDGALALQLDCNRGTGHWEAKPTSSAGGTLSITGGAMTRAMCQPGAMDTQIAGDLSRVRSYALVGSELSLTLEAGAGTYLWAPSPSDHH